MTGSRQSWAVVVPVKRLDIAKSRLDVAPDVRADLALAMASDTVRACAGSARVAAVVVVTDDEQAAAVMRELGATVVADEPDAGLNPALRHGARAAAAVPAARSVAAVSSDLPALTAQALDAVLERADGVPRGCVADAAGTGTTLLTARNVGDFDPRFGPLSWQRHVDAGAIDLTPQADARVRRDVDTLVDLADALRLGCGPATTAAAARALGTGRLS